MRITVRRDGKNDPQGIISPTLNFLNSLYLRLPLSHFHIVVIHHCWLLTFNAHSEMSDHCFSTLRKLHSHQPISPAEAF